MKRILLLFIIIISLCIIYNFFNSIYRLWHKKDVVLQARQELLKIQKENADLKRQLQRVKDPKFVEEQARDNLFLVKPGENTVIIPKSLLPTLTPTKALTVPKPNWQRWMQLF